MLAWDQAEEKEETRTRAIDAPLPIVQSLELRRHVPDARKLIIAT